MQYYNLFTVVGNVIHHHTNFRCIVSNYPKFYLELITNAILESKI